MITHPFKRFQNAFETQDMFRFLAFDVPTHALMVAPASFQHVADFIDLRIYRSLCHSLFPEDKGAHASTAPMPGTQDDCLDIQNKIYEYSERNSPMPLYIRDSSVDDLAEQVRIRLGARTKTDAVRAALQHELERAEAAVPLREKFASLRSRARKRLGPPVHGVDMKKLMDELWEEGE
jgi:antitoxin VapB